MGCLTAPFKLLGCLVLVAALGLGWLYRDRLEHEARRVIDRVRHVAPSAAGRPGVSALESWVHLEVVKESYASVLDSAG